MRRGAMNGRLIAIILPLMMLVVVGCESSE
jgi:hypothetical protein